MRTARSAILPGVEQRTGTDVVAALSGAGTDPSFVPGLIGPVAGRRETAAEAVAEPVRADAEPEPEPEAEAVEAFEDAGVEFEAADHRGSIAAGPAGLRFRLDGETAEFRWAEIGAVEVDTPRFARRFGVTVYTTERRRYDAEVTAPDRAARTTWLAEFDAVLDKRFEA
ncbi:hypothetical protein SCATT_32760 [Streptantibioticus cattleyicolor NRRL 8057 = DSM 46488]|uniref:Uncharacterized protein n=1 Tax=Streptantibioticus cattleyicolor (strain ATCC 35852 / DSM 46488 / JCM 4925 / NBRC 14057 / NRRL 8057) TaxID=1003195 RepID=G8X2Q6_STREN|nr:hypothetical protein SCATT_32760 [Streptantibioticus cattleyicolor NRRL 8057 = DSM 46488]